MRPIVVDYAFNGRVRTAAAAFMSGVLVGVTVHLIEDAEIGMAAFVGALALAKFGLMLYEVRGTPPERGGTP